MPRRTASRPVPSPSLSTPADERLQAIARDHELRADHPPAVRTETAAWVADPGIDDPALEDLRHLPFVTIDEPHSRDLDQAVFVEQGVEQDGDGFTVWYAIADAAHFVSPDVDGGRALFAEALERGSTFYLPGAVYPMLPRELSEDLVSINPDVDRRALVFHIELDRDGAVRRTRLRRARVRSRSKTSYQAVQAWYDGDAAERRRVTDDVARSLDALRAVAEARMARAAAHDVVQVSRREIAVSTDGLRFVAMADPRHDSERYNEQISLLANVEGAHFLAEGVANPEDDPVVQGVFRFHRPPRSRDLEELRRSIDALVGHATRDRRFGDLDSEAWSWHRRGRGGGRQQSLADYLAQLPVGKDRADDPVADARQRLARAIHRQALLAGGRAGFAPVPGIHHGVGAQAYARFTAPMREVVGIFVHKETWEKLGLIPPGDPARDRALREDVMSAADRSRGLQRRLDAATNRLVLDQLFGDDLAGRDKNGEAPSRRATVMGITRSKVHVQFDDPPVDCKVYLRHLADYLGKNVEPGRDGVSLRAGGRHFLGLGDAVDVRVLGTDRGRDRWCLGVDPV